MGDNICVLDNSIAVPELEGKTGVVVQVDDDTVVVLDQSSESEVSCLSTLISSLTFRQVHRWIRFFGDLHWEYK